MADRWEELEKRCQDCRECSLCETRTNVVFGDGSRTAEIMFVGEGPGAHEDEQGVPFVGKAGQLLDDMLAIIGLDRTMVYIANKITREHGQWVKKGGFELMAMYHPAALLRDPARRPDAFEDLMSLREKVRAVCEHTPLPEKL